LKLRTILNESDAAEEAKKKGLDSDSFGRWKDKSGKVVAMTDPKTGKLKPVSEDDQEEPKDQSSHQAKPSSMSAQDAGTATKSAPDQTDIQKQNGTLGQDRKGELDPSGGGEGGPQANPMQTVKINPHVVNSLKIEFGKPVDRIDIKKYIDDASDPLHGKTDFVVGEQVVLSNEDETHRFLHPHVGSEQFKLDAEYKHAAAQQTVEWRNKLPPKAYKALATIQHSWQEVDPHTERDFFNKAFQSITKKKPPKTQLNRPVERGVRFSDEGALRQFLKNIRIGEPVNFPTLGFTAKPETARRIADTSGYGVLIRLSPDKNNEIYGIHCDTSYDGSKLSPSDVQIFQQTANNFSDEQEIIRYPGPAAKCVNVTKVLTKSQTPSKEPFTKFLLIIDLEEQGYPEKNITEGRSMALHPVQRRLKAMLEDDPAPNNTGPKSPADTAHELGLVSMGGPYWADPTTGDVVAKTIGDNLIKWNTNEPYTKNHNPQSSPKLGQSDPETMDKDMPQGVQAPAPEGKSTVPMEFKSGMDLVGKKLNGVAFEPWVDALQNKDNPSWWNAMENSQIKEPEWPQSSKKRAAGVIVIEPDGRFWLVEPANHFGGYEHTFPKGKIDQGMNSQGTAVKEAYEESGLQVEITGYAADSERTTSITRYYFAKRVGGDPTTHGWESQAVKLVPPNQLDKYLNTDIDKQLAQQLLSKVHDHGPVSAPAEHPEQKVNAQKSNVMHKKIGEQKGTNKGGFYEGKDGVLRYVKEYKDPSRSECEVLADKMYVMAGISAPAAQVIDDHGQKLFASDVIKGAELGDILNATNSTGRKTICQKICSGFAMDVLMANWDTIGLELDNIIVDHNGEPWRVDQGGSFVFSAMESSGRKPEGALGGISEWEVFNSPSNKYSEILKMAEYSKPEEIPDIQQQIKTIRTLETKLGGWEKIVGDAAPNLAPNDKEMVVKMLKVRSQLLYTKALELRFHSRDI
jgi:ADP-ribose pyrophosphatase YjhB (NUDIX family)